MGLEIEFKNTGNVEANLLTNITITKDGMYIERITEKADTVQIQDIKTQTLTWNTTGKISGDYIAHFKITFDDGEIAHEEDVAFELHPPGIR